SSTRKPALADFSSWHFQQCCLRNGRTRCSYVLWLSADRPGLTFGPSPASTPPREKARRHVSPRMLLRFIALATRGRWAGSVAGGPGEEVVMELKPVGGRQVAGQAGQVFWLSVPLF